MREAIAALPASILVVEQIGSFLRDGKLEEALWLEREVGTKLIAPAMEDVEREGGSLLLSADSPTLGGAALVFGPKVEGGERFRQLRLEELEEARLPETSLFRLVEEVSTLR